MGIPQFILLILYTMSLGMRVYEASEKPDKSAWSAILAYAVTMGLLWWGGFFT